MTDERIHTPHSRRPPTAAVALLAAALVAAGGAPAAAAQCTGQRWVGAWAAAPSDAATSFSSQSLRLVVTPLRSGRVARVRLSNRFGTRRLRFGRVYLGRQRSGPRLDAGSNRAVGFRGRRGVTVPAGGAVVSDPVRIGFHPFQQLAVSVYVRGWTGPATEHFDAHQTSFTTPPGTGDRSARVGGAGFSIATSARPFLTGIDVRGSRRDGVLAAVGDSITDGAQLSTTLRPLGLDADARYPDFLARRLNARRRGLRFSVLNEGIGGNRILRDGAVPLFGRSLLSRLGADVLDRRDVTDVILLAGINDLGQPPFASASQVIHGLARAVRRLRAVRRGRRLNVLVGTITPAAGSRFPGYQAAEPRRRAVNRYIRRGRIGDGVVDFDRALRDPGDPGRLAPRYDSGDGLHPSSAGYRRMARAVTLSRLRGPAC